jgi:hypothetical protein
VRPKALAAAWAACTAAVVAPVLLGVALAVGAIAPPGTAGDQPSTPRPVEPSALAPWPSPSPSPYPTPSPAATTSPSVAPSATIAPEPTKRPAPTPRPTARPRNPQPTPRLGGSKVSGAATWYCWPAYPSPCTRGYDWRGAYAAAGPALRAALGPRWRGRHVWVNGVEVTLVDFCACSGNHAIDVFHQTWITIPHPEAVVIRW